MSMIDSRGMDVMTVGAIAAVREPLLDAQIQAEASLAASLAAQKDNLQNVGARLGETISLSATPNGLKGLAAELSGLFESFQSLAKDPSNVPLRQSVVRGARDVAAQFNRAASRLQSVKWDLDASIQKDVIQANRALAEIARLNERIFETRAAGKPAGSVLTRREHCLETLSAYASITATPKSDGSIMVRIGGVIMVFGAEVADNLATYPDKHGHLRLQAQDSGRRLKLKGGSIAGKIAVRDGALAGLQHGLDTLAAQLIARVNATYNSGVALNGGAVRDFFTGADASDISVNNAIAGDPARLRVERAAQNLARLGQSNVSGLGHQTFGQRFAQTVSEFDTALTNINDDLTGSRAMKQMLANERLAARGASLEAEMANLTQYEEACAGSAKVIAVLDKMLSMQ